MEKGKRMSDDLKSCPFCGGRRVEVMWVDYAYRSVCLSEACGAYGPRVAPKGEAEDEQNSACETAAEHWNTRTDIAERERKAAVAAAYERAAKLLDNHDGAPMRPNLSDYWTEDRIDTYETGQMDAALSWQRAIRALATDDERGALAEVLAEKDAEIERLRAWAIRGFNEGFEMAASLTPHVFDVLQDRRRAWTNSRTRAALNDD